MSSQKLHPYSTPTGFAHAILDSRAPSRRSLTPNGRVLASSARLMSTIEGDLGAEDDPRLAVFKDLYAKSEARLASLFESQESGEGTSAQNPEGELSAEDDPITQLATQPSTNLKRKRSIEEDDYDDESEEEEAVESTNVSPLKSRSTIPPPHHALASVSMLRSLSQNSNTGSARGAPGAGKTTEEARKKLEEDKKASEDAAKRTSHTMFYTLENDKDAMLEQRKLEELERKVDAELGTTGASNSAAGTAQHGTLSQTNLGSSSLTLKNLIKRIDDKRDMVQATDLELRALMSEVRKNRSKWASEEKVGQEELYESLEKVLSELKGHTEHSTHFLQKVNKKEAPDYGTIIKHPMDLGTMTKKLKNFSYKSKKDFAEDLFLIWSNCLKYNASAEHYMRKHALFMRKQTEKLVPLIPDIYIRDRAEVEAEERRLQHGVTDMDGDEESDDEPIISSRGRKAPSKKAKKGTTARKAPAGAKEGTPNNEGRSVLPNGVHISKEDNSRPDSEHAEGSQTPPHGTATPTGVNGILAAGGLGISNDMDVDNESMVNGVVPSIPELNEEPEFEDIEYKIWKNVTKKDRAIATAERHRLFKGDHALDPEAPALLRTKAAMRSWLRKQKQGVNDESTQKPILDLEAKESGAQAKGETLAEGMEGEDENVLPDYYDPLAAIPDVAPRLQWVEDSNGVVQDPSDNFLRELPKGRFTAPSGPLKRKIDDNMYQVQKTRKVTTKIGVVKQMALQSQLYQGQFQKSEIIPLSEQDIEPYVMSDDGPVIAPQVTRAALQRSTAQLLIHAGFEEFQPSALEAFTDMAGDYFQKIAQTLVQYAQAPNVPVPVNGQPNKVKWKNRFTREECILHTLQENGADLEALDTYVNEDIDRMGARLTATHDRMKSHLADLLRPALHDAGPDGSGAFNDDSEQFISGDFAEELGDDFFGFKELGLDVEFGDASMSVPLHLLQKSMYNANQSQNANSGAASQQLSLPEPARYAPITVDNVGDQVGLVQDFFRNRLRANGDKPLTEDDDLPVKQRMPKPRLGPWGKITSPRKRPFKEPGPGKGHPRKKMKLNEGDGAKIGENEVAIAGPSAGENAAGDPVKKAAPAPRPVPGSQAMSREPSRTSEAATREPLERPMTNGVVNARNDVDAPFDPFASTTPAEKGKSKETNGDSLPSPESLGGNTFVET